MSAATPPIHTDGVAHPFRARFSRERVGGLLQDYSELIKLRVTSLIVLSAWAGAYFAAPRAGVAQLSWPVLHALIGISLIAAGSAALNEVFEKDVDALMRRTAHRPLPSKRMGLVHASMVSGMLVFGGALYLALFWARVRSLRSRLRYPLPPARDLSSLCAWARALRMGYRLHLECLASVVATVNISGKEHAVSIATHKRGALAPK